MKMKGIASFFGLCAYRFGSISGVGYALYREQYLLAVCIGVLAAMAFPTAKNWFKNLTDV